MPAQQTSTHNVILGFGNQALSDDVAGVKVARYIIKNYSPISAFRIIDAGILNHQLTSVLEQARNLVVVEAACLGQAPGTVSLFVGADMDNVLRRPQRNANEMALADMLEIARLAGCLPENRLLIAIEPKKITWGNRVSACVSKALPQMAEQALSTMSQWTGVSYQPPEPPSKSTAPAPSARQGDP